MTKKITRYECSELIKGLKYDIKEFGGDTYVAVWCKDIDGETFYTDYAFINPDVSLRQMGVSEGEYLTIMTMISLLMQLEEQKRVL